MGAVMRAGPSYGTTTTKAFIGTFYHGEAHLAQHHFKNMYLESFSTVRQVLHLNWIPLKDFISPF